MSGSEPPRPKVSSRSQGAASHAVTAGPRLRNVLTTHTDQGDVVSENRRLLGAYYSPEPYARLLVRWALGGRAGTVLDPSYGGCAMLRAGLDELRLLGAEQPSDLVFGTDIDDGTSQWSAHLVSQGVPSDHLRAADFLSLAPDVELPRAAAVVGNPPYVRHHRLGKEARIQAVKAAAEAGIRLSGRASLWAYFVVHATRFVQPGGRMALLLPGAVLQADYADEVLSCLERSFERVSLVRVRERIFDDAQEETVVLLADGAAPERPIGTCQFGEVDDLAGLERLLTDPPVQPKPRLGAVDGVAAWKAAALPAACLDLLHRILDRPQARTLGAVARVSLGTVTGANDIFVLSHKQAELLDVRHRTMPVVSRSAWLSGPVLSAASLTRACGPGRGRLLVLPNTVAVDRRTRLGRFLSAAEANGVDTRHHCRREPWWALGNVPQPDAFVPYTVGSPRGVALNSARAASTNTVHQVTWGKPFTEQQQCAWALSTWSTIGRLCAELYGRHYGGGVLKLELSAARRLPVFDGLTVADTEWAACRHDASRARATADAALLAIVGLNQTDMDVLKAAADALAAQRVAPPPGGSAANRSLLHPDRFRTA